MNLNIIHSGRPLVEAKSESESDDANHKFVTKRKKGASEIATKSAKKGGYSQLTAWHFKAKLPAYDAAMRALKNNEPREFFANKVKKLLRSLQPRTMTQAEFQKVMGELEVWGEVLIQLKSGRTY